MAFNWTAISTPFDDKLLQKACTNPNLGKHCSGCHKQYPCIPKHLICMYYVCTQNLMPGWKDCSDDKSSQQNSTPPPPPIHIYFRWKTQNIQRRHRAINVEWNIYRSDQSKSNKNLILLSLHNKQNICTDSSWRKYQSCNQILESMFKDLLVIKKI